jgi:peptidoglycan/LPS O-acetylase OafA/YrhL
MSLHVSSCPNKEQSNSLIAAGVQPDPSAIPKRNNLEILRLLFAVQVLIEHAGSHLGFYLPSFLSHVPGVPAFFFVSGFLIYASYLNAPGPRYAMNRLLRIFPGLVFVSLGGVIVAATAHGWSDILDNARIYAGWFLAQITIGQAYNPQHFRDIGVGAINGSLWTITTEILFYTSIPVIVKLERRWPWTIAALAIASFATYAGGPSLWQKPVYRDKTIYDILALTPIVWGWMFAAGILAFKYFKAITRARFYLPIAAVLMGLIAKYGGAGPLLNATGNSLGLLYFLSYACILLWFAFCLPAISIKTDLSYGVYVWHMPIINLQLALNIQHPIIAIIGTFMVATLSWFAVEKPFLKLKRASLKTSLG